MDSPWDINEIINRDPELSSFLSNYRLDQGSPRQGTFSHVYTFVPREGQGALLAVKLFKEDRFSEEIFEVYRGIIEYVEKLEGDYFCKCHRIVPMHTNVGRTAVLVMEWVDGMPMGNYVENHAEDLKAIYSFLEKFIEIVKWMKERTVAHGDLQCDNIIFSEDSGIKVIDLDSVFFPEISYLNFTKQSFGHVHFQHPLRIKNGDMRGPNMDDFSSWVIILSLLAIGRSPSLLINYRISLDDRLLFGEGDYLQLFYGNSYGKENVIIDMANNEDPLISSVGKIMSSIVLQYPTILPLSELIAGTPKSEDLIKRIISMAHGLPTPRPALNQCLEGGKEIIEHEHSVNSIINAANKVYKNGDFRKAINILDQGILDHPDNGELHYYRGLSLKRTESRTLDAIFDFERTEILSIGVIRSKAIYEKAILIFKLQNKSSDNMKAALRGFKKVDHLGNRDFYRLGYMASCYYQLYINNKVDDDSICQAAEWVKKAQDMAEQIVKISENENYSLFKAANDFLKSNKPLFRKISKEAELILDEIEYDGGGDY